MDANEFEEYLILEKMGELNSELIGQTSMVQANSREEYALDYIGKAFYFLANTLKYDRETAKVVKDIEDKNERLKVYHQRLNLKKCILEGMGVCRQFATYLTYLIANENSGPSRFGIDVKCNIINCRVVLKNGRKDLHTLCEFTIGGKSYYCDLSMAISHKEVMQAFCLKSKEELQQAFNVYDDGSSIDGRVARFNVEQDKLIPLFNVLENFCDKQKINQSISFSDL